MQNIFIISWILGRPNEYLSFLGKLPFVIMFPVGFSIDCQCPLQTINATTGRGNLSVYCVSNIEHEKCIWRSIKLFRQWSVKVFGSHCSRYLLYSFSLREKAQLSFRKTKGKLFSCLSVIGITATKWIPLLFWHPEAVLLWLTEVLMKLSGCMADEHLSLQVIAGSCPAGPQALSSARVMPGWDGAAGDKKSVSQHTQHGGFRFTLLSLRTDFGSNSPGRCVRAMGEDRAIAKGHEDLWSTKFRPRSLTAHSAI